MVGKDTKFKKQYTIIYEGISKKGGFVEDQTYQEDLMDQMIEGTVKAINMMRKTCKATLEIKKIK